MQVIGIRKYSPMKLMEDNKTVTGVNLENLFHRLDLLRPQFAALIELYEAGKISPHVDRSLTFDGAPAAHHYLHDRKAIGKVVLVP